MGQLGLEASPPSSLSSPSCCPRSVVAGWAATVEDLFGQLADQVCALAPASALEGGMTRMRTKKRSSGFLSSDWLGWGTGNTVGLALVVAAQRQTVVEAKETLAVEQ